MRPARSSLFSPNLRPNRRQILFAVALLALTGLPILSAAGVIPACADQRARACTAGIERILALLAVLGAGVAAWRAMRQNENATAVDTGPMALDLLPLLPIGAYAFWLSEAAFRALLLWDTDYAGISAAINNTRLGLGALATPYFPTGTTSSYLGHHFSPGLLLLVPFYSVAHGLGELWPQLESGHRVYGWLLAAWGCAGIVVWGNELRRAVGAQTGNLLLLLLAFAFPIFRQIQSFHYEMPVLFFSGLAVFAQRRGKLGLFWLAILGWLVWKEDLAVYVGLYGLILFSQASTRRLGFGVGVAALVTFFSVRFLIHPALAGPHAPEWNYWTGWQQRGLQIKPFVEMLAAFGFLTLAAPRTWLAVLPIGVLHALSAHSWHATYYGHYSYALTPFLLMGAVQAVQNLSWWMGRRYYVACAAAAVAVCLYVSAGEKEAPLTLPKGDDLQMPARGLLTGLPPGSCLQADSRYSAQAPLRVITLPYFPPQNNPLAAHVPDLRHAGPQAWRKLPDFCQHYFVLLDHGRLPPYGSPEQQSAIKTALNSAGKPIGTAGPLTLFEITRPREPLP